MKNKEETALYQAMQAGDQATFAQLLLANAPFTPDGLSLLMHAVIEADEGLIKALIAKGVDLDYCNKEGNTALMLACILGYLTIVQLLIANGARLDLVNNEGKNALQLAEEEQEKAIVDYLAST